MNILISCESYYTRNNFIGALIPKGVALFHAEHQDQVIQKLSENKIDILVLDVIQEDFVNIFSLMKSIKNSPDDDLKKTAIILLIGVLDKSNVTQAIQNGAIGFIRSNASEEVIGNYIIEIYQKIKGIPAERKFARISLDTSNPGEKIGVKFRSPINAQLIMGLIKDISFGGIAVELVGTFPPECLTTGIEIKNIQFIIGGKDFYIDAVVVAYRNNFCAFRFTNMLAQEKDIISQFIFQKTSLDKSERPISAAELVKNESSPVPSPEPGNKDPKSDN